MDQARCIICDSPEYRVLFPANLAQIHRIVQCLGCGFMYAHPQSSEKVEGKVSLDQLQDPAGKEGASGSYEDFERSFSDYLQKQMLQQKDYRKCLNVLQRLNYGGSLLEIGAFSGHFLKAAERFGFKVSGIEPMAHAVTYAKKHLHLDLIPLPFERAELPPHSFDVACIFHVIEHVYQPEPFLEKIRGVLKKDGVLVIETPCYDTLAFKLLRHRERSMRCNGHMYFFTKNSLKALAEKCGFKMVHFERVGRTLSLARLLVNLDIILGRKNHKPWLSRFNQALRLEKVALTLNMHDIQRMYCAPN